MIWFLVFKVKVFFKQTQSLITFNWKFNDLKQLNIQESLRLDALDEEDQ